MIFVSSTMDVLCDPFLMTKDESDLFKSLNRATDANTNSVQDLFKSSVSNNIGLLSKLSNYFCSPPIALRTRSKLVTSRRQNTFREFSSSKFPNFSTYERHQLIMASGDRETTGGPSTRESSMKDISIPEEQESDENKKKPFFSTPGPSMGVGSNPNVVLNMAKFTPILYADSPLQNSLTVSLNTIPMVDVTNQVELWSSTSINRLQVSTSPKFSPPSSNPSPYSSYSARALGDNSQLFGIPLGKKSDAHLKRLTSYNISYMKLFEEHDAEAILLKLADQKSFVKLSQLFPKNRMHSLIKIGEGTFSEVFSYIDGDVATKLIPIEGKVHFNGALQKKFTEVFSEVIVSKEVTNLKSGNCNRTENFVQLKKLSLACGKLPQALIKAWELFRDEQGSENDHPKIFNSKQRWIALECALCGPALETAVPICPVACLSVFCQTAFALAVAENRLSFEHRDLHWGNILIDNRPSSTATATTGCAGADTAHCRRAPDSLIANRLYRPPPGPFVSIVDFTLSRLEHANQPLFLDLSLDEELFTGKGDIQFDIYRQMRKEVGDDWSLFRPRTNLFWLHYLISKLTSTVSRTKPKLDPAGPCPRDAAHREARKHLASLAKYFQTVSLSSSSSVGHFIATFPLFRSMEVPLDL